MTRIVHILPPRGAPTAYVTLGHEFAPMLRAVGLDVTTIEQGQPAPFVPDVVTYSMDPQPELIAAYPGARHVQPFVDGDFTPIEGVERIYPSRAWLNWNVGKYGDSARGPVVPNWVTPELWPMGRGDADFVLFVGRLWPQKTGILAQLIRAMPGIEFKVAGAGNRAHLEAPNVTFLGQLSQSEVSALMGEALAVLCPSDYCEPFGLAAVEAGLTGALVLASDVGAFPETVPTWSRLLDPRGLHEWIEAIRCAAPQDFRYDRRRWHAEKHSPETIGPMFAKVLT